MWKKLSKFDKRYIFWSKMFKIDIQKGSKWLLLLQNYRLGKGSDSFGVQIDYFSLLGVFLGLLNIK